LGKSRSKKNQCWVHKCKLRSELQEETEIPVMDITEAVVDQDTAPPAQERQVPASKPKKSTLKALPTFSNRCGCSGLISTSDEELLKEEIHRLREVLSKARSDSLAQENVKPKGFFLNCACTENEPHSLGEAFPAEPLNASKDFWSNEIRTLRRAIAETVVTNHFGNQEAAEAIYVPQIRMTIGQPELSPEKKRKIQEERRNDDEWAGAMDVEARWSDNKWYEVHVHERQFDGTYNCYFLGTQTEAYVPPHRLRVRRETTTPISVSPRSSGALSSSSSSKRKREDISNPKPPVVLEVIPVPPVLNAFVIKHMKGFNCGAHDVAHVYRVANLAQKIAAAEGANQMVTFVAGLVHDILDSKLIDAEDMASSQQEMTRILKNEMSAFIPEWQDTDVDKVLEICKSVGYKNLLKIDWNPQDRSLEYKCVQDADLLDAIGAVGIARCFAFGGKRNRLMFGVSDVVGSGITAEQYKVQSQNGSGVEHFFDKLLLIKDMMTTRTGKKMAQPRHQAMIDYLKTLETELVEGEMGVEETEMKSILNLFM